MGLDNGIQIRTFGKSIKKEFCDLYKSIFPKYPMSFDEWVLDYETVYNKNSRKWEEIQRKPENVQYDLEVTYWRKCWNIREVINFIVPSFDEDGCAALSIDNMYDIIVALAEQNNKDTWNEAYEDGQTIWDADTMIGDRIDESSLADDMRAIAVAAKMKELHPEIEVYFYDSY